MWHLKTRLIKHTEKDKKKQEDALIIEKTITSSLMATTTIVFPHLVETK